MINIQLTSSRGDFILYENGEPVLNLKRSNWFSKASEMVYLESLIEIKPRNIWGRKFDIFDSGRIIGEILIKQMGKIEIEMQGASYKKHRFFLKRRGFLSPRYALFNDRDLHLLTLLSKFDWSKFNFNYNVEILNWEADDVDIYELLTYCAYSINIYRKHRQSKG